MMRVVEAWKIHTDDDMFLPSRMSCPKAAIVKVPGVVQYTPGYRTLPDSSAVLKSLVHVLLDAAFVAIMRSAAH